LPAAIELGRRLFADARFSANGAVSCASCHDPRKQFQDGLPVGRGVGTGSRRAMPIVGAGHGTWFFWDGRKDSLWAQALGPLEDAVEHGSNRTRYAHLLASNYRKEYESLFGAMPWLEQPAAGRRSPGGRGREGGLGRRWIRRQREAVSRVFANMGKAIAAYEKSLHHEAIALDRYVDAVAAGQRSRSGLLQPGEVRGLGCSSARASASPATTGRYSPTSSSTTPACRPATWRGPTGAVLTRRPRCATTSSTAWAVQRRTSQRQCQELRFMVDDDPALVGAFKTPGLRGVAQRAPYMHAGQLATLGAVGAALHRRAACRRRALGTDTPPCGQCCRPQAR
jgi:cytochrome c peroxidase